MPINGGTRMLRARRKDINVKPNRRLDRKSSRGMLFENEELRMRTITINAEVEQGQHALKKLRRENEQLRREMWCLRDEYDKMEKLLRKKKSDDDSDQENTDSDDNYSQSEDSEDEKQRVEGEEEDSEGNQTEPKYGNVTAIRAFDGLSVIDEQTEETTTQTTESAVGYCTASRGNSANRTLNQVTPAGIRAFDDSPCDYPTFYDSPYPKMTHRKKMYPMYETDSTYVTYATDWPDNGYDVRPASPYPYPESVQPSYQRRFEVLQNLPPMMSRVTNPEENNWMFPAKTDYEVFPRDANPPAASTFHPEKSATSPISVQIPQDIDYSVIQDRTGPDVFIADVCAKKSVPQPEDDAAAEDETIKNVEEEIEKIEISERQEKNAKAIASQSESCKTNEGVAPAKLTMAESVDKGDQIDQRETVEDSVSCQNPSQQDVQQTVESEEMAKADKTSKFQSRLMVTLKTPASKPDGRATLKRVPPVQVPTARSYNTIGYGIKPEYHGQRFFGYPECRYTSAAACRLANGGAVPSSPVPSSMAAAQGKINDDVMEAANIPLQQMQEGIGLLSEAETTACMGGASLKPVKIPPAPPPRTTSCAATTIPDSSIGVTAMHHRTFRGANLREPQEPIEPYPETFVHNPLMMSEPMATSSPTTSPRMFQRSHNLSLDNLSYHRKPTGLTANDESSTEDVSTRKSHTTGRGGRVGDFPHLNKSVSSPSFGTFLRRKASEHSVSSFENGTISSHHRKICRGNPQNNVSISSSSGLDSPTKSDRRKRRVSIKFNKKIPSDEGVDRGGSDSRKARGKAKSRHDETDVTTSERERTNSVSSRASSGIGGSGRRKFSVSSNRTYINDEKIPWCGCWGNGCV